MTSYMIRIVALSLAIVVGLAAHAVSEGVIETAERDTVTAADTLS